MPTVTLIGHIPTTPPNVLDATQEPTSSSWTPTYPLQNRQLLILSNIKTVEDKRKIFEIVEKDCMSWINAFLNAKSQFKAETIGLNDYLILLDRCLRRFDFLFDLLNNKVREYEININFLPKTSRNIRAHRTSFSLTNKASRLLFESLLCKVIVTKDTLNKYDSEAYQEYVLLQNQVH